MFGKILLIISMILLPFVVKAQSKQYFSDFPDSCKISLITCYPGPVVYELYGHTAIRVQSEGYDLAYNFGMFSFNKPNFIYSFVKGETDYMLGYTPFEGDRYSNFVAEYRYRGSRIVEQELNISNEAAINLWQELCYLSLPENREYRYNYVLDNCATRPRDMIEKAVGGLKYPTPTDTTLTFRKMMRSYSPNYPWYQFGIDLALGSGIDYTLTTKQQHFAPIYLMNSLAGATYADSLGRQVPIIAKTNILYEGTNNAILPPTPWYETPMAVAILALLLIGFATFGDYKRRKVSKWVDCVWSVVVGLTGCLITFLVFFSVHEATSPNALIVWLNPFALLSAIFIWIKSAQKWVFYYHFINFAVVFALLVFWWALPQCADPAIFPLMACSVIRSANYIVIHRDAKKKSCK